MLQYVLIYVYIQSSRESFDKAGISSRPTSIDPTKAIQYNPSPERSHSSHRGHMYAGGDIGVKGHQQQDGGAPAESEGNTNQGLYPAF